MTLPYGTKFGHIPDGSCLEHQSRESFLQRMNDGIEMWQKDWLMQPEGAIWENRYIYIAIGLSDGPRQRWMNETKAERIRKILMIKNAGHNVDDVNCKVMVL